MLSQWQMQYQITPIILTGGLAGSISGSMLPLLALTNTNAFSDNLLSGDPGFALEDAFGIFQPAVGGTLVEQVVAKYPFANLNVAANAIIRNEINVSLIMITPMNQEGAWATKLAVMTALKATLDAHNNAGGTYIVMTPAYTYFDMLMVNLTDVSIAQSPVPQNAWRWDFTKPLVSLIDAAGALNNLMNQVSNGTAPVGGDSATTGPPSALTSNAPSSTNQGSGAGGSAPVVSSIPIGGGAGNTMEAPTGTPGGAVPGITPSDIPLDVNPFPSPGTVPIPDSGASLGTVTVTTPDGGVITAPGGMGYGVDPSTIRGPQ